MSFETGTATGIADLFNKIRAFGNANGFTEDSFSDSGTAGSWVCHSATGRYHRLEYRGTGSTYDFLYRGSTDGVSFTTYGARTEYFTSASIPQYFIFGGDEYLHIVVNLQPTQWVNFGFGLLDKHGTYSGGEYGYGCSLVSTSASTMADYRYNHWPFGFSDYGIGGAQGEHTDSPGVVRYSTTEYADEWCYRSGALNTTGSSCTAHIHSIGSSAANEFQYRLLLRSPNQVNGVSVMLPLEVYVQIRSSGHYLAGVVPDVRWINVKELADGEIVTLGSDQWYCFPIVRNTAFGTGTGLGSSLNVGMAYKRVD